MVKRHRPPRKAVPALYPEGLVSPPAEVRLNHNGDVGACTLNPSHKPQKCILEAYQSCRRDLHHHQVRSAELIEW